MKKIKALMNLTLFFSLSVSAYADGIINTVQLNPETIKYLDVSKEQLDEDRNEHNGRQRHQWKIQVGLNNNKGCQIVANGERHEVESLEISIQTRHRKRHGIYYSTQPFTRAELINLESLSIFYPPTAIETLKHEFVTQTIGYGVVSDTGFYGSLEGFSIEDLIVLLTHVKDGVALDLLNSGAVVVTNNIHQSDNQRTNGTAVSAAAAGSNGKKAATASGALANTRVSSSGADQRAEINSSITHIAAKNQSAPVLLAQYECDVEGNVKPILMLSMQSQ